MVIMVNGKLMVKLSTFQHQGWHGVKAAGLACHPTEPHLVRRMRAMTNKKSHPWPQIEKARNA